jgi:hypothetical protein
MNFELSVLHFTDMTVDQRAELKANGCTYIRRLNLWLYEGDWDICFEKTDNIIEVGKVILEQIPNYLERELLITVAKQLKIDPMQTYVPTDLKTKEQRTFDARQIGEWTNPDLKTKE